MKGRLKHLFYLHLKDGVILKHKTGKDMHLRSSRYFFFSKAHRAWVTTVETLFVNVPWSIFLDLVVLRHNPFHHPLGSKNLLGSRTRFRPITKASTAASREGYGDPPVQWAVSLLPVEAAAYCPRTSPPTTSEALNLLASYLQWIDKIVLSIYTTILGVIYNLFDLSVTLSSVTRKPSKTRL